MRQGVDISFFARCTVPFFLPFVASLSFWVGSSGSVGARSSASSIPNTFCRMDWARVMTLVNSFDFPPRTDIVVAEISIEASRVNERHVGCRPFFEISSLLSGILLCSEKIARRTRAQAFLSNS